MGTAYKEMDLMDEAIQEFQTSANLVKPGDGTSRFLQCCNMLGHCFNQKGMPEAAVLWFKKGLQAPGHTEDEYQALRYELGAAYEQLGDLKQAREFYTEVYGVDVSYREVAEKLSQLRQKQE
jgi:tetratricopeptide (TPR) repeat protein